MGGGQVARAHSNRPARWFAVLALVAGTTSASAFADVRQEKRMELMASELMRMIKRAETQPPLGPKDFAKSYRRAAASTIPELCRCRERYPFERKMRAHCAMDAIVGMMLDIMPVVIRQPGVLDEIKAAMTQGEAAADAFGEKVVTALMEETIPAKERLRLMKQMHECTDL